MTYMPLTPRAGLFIILGFTYDTKKGVGVCSSAHPGALGLRIASPHRIDNAS